MSDVSRIESGSCQPSRNQSGNIVIAMALILFCMIASSTLVMAVDQMINTNSRERGRDLKRSLKDIVTMALSREYVCNLNFAGLPLNTGSISSMAALGFPDDSGIAIGGEVVSKNNGYYMLKVSDFSLTENDRLFPGRNAYLAELRLEVHAAQLDAVESILVPMYLVTDASGMISRCRSTWVTKDQSVSPPRDVTLEDSICHLHAGAGKRYDPEVRSCI